MEAIFINRVLSIKEESEILKKISTGTGCELFSNVELSTKLSAFNKGLIELSPEEKKKINYDIFDKVIQFGETKIKGKAITDLLMIEKASIWHYHKFRTYFYIRNLCFDIQLVERLLKTFKKISFYTNQPALANYRFSSSHIFIITAEITPSKTYVMTFVKYVMFFKLRVFSSFLFAKSHKRKQHIIIDHSIKQTCLNLYTLKPERGNYNLQYLFENLDASYIILKDFEIPKFKTGNSFTFTWKDLNPGNDSFFGESILLKGILSKKIRNETKQSTQHIYKTLSLIKSDLNEGIDNLIIDYLLTLQKSNKLFLFKYFSYKAFFKNSSLKTISSIDENSPRIKTIFDAAKMQSVKTIGLQHGTIHDLHPAYIYTKEDIDRHIIPDYTIVWGKHWANFLNIKGNFPKDSLAISGQIRTDIIGRLKNLSKQNYFDIGKDKKLIMFASQPQRDPVLREKAAYDVFTAVKDLKDVELVLKLHPAESNDLNYYRAIAKRAKCQNYRMVLDFDLYLLISMSDIVITCFSTVGAETAYFFKPLIILDHLKQDIQQYYKEGIAFQTSGSEELNEAIRGLLSGKIEMNKNNYEEYIQKYAYSIDGKVSERILQFIKNC